ncbi:hypothetical protein [Nodularia sphaerocarpa]|uniref:hypothetical protein n=1 Tax=Nodularia sphaerocarpa TaxID=137816 RepID=UPI001EFB7E66|nr:hypothetical protein [Nodularia sphaerocarpa]
MLLQNSYNSEDLNALILWQPDVVAATVKQELPTDKGNLPKSIISLNTPEYRYN